MMKEFLIGCVCAWLLPLAAQTEPVLPFGEMYASVLQTLQREANTQEIQITQISNKLIIAKYSAFQMTYEFDSAGCYAISSESTFSNPRRAIDRYIDGIDRALGKGAVAEKKDSTGQYTQRTVLVRSGQVHTVSLSQTGDGPYTVKTALRQPALTPVRLRNAYDRMALARMNQE